MRASHLLRMRAKSRGASPRMVAPPCRLHPEGRRGAARHLRLSWKLSVYIKVPTRAAVLALSIGRPCKHASAQKIRKM